MPELPVSSEPPSFDVFAPFIVDGVMLYPHPKDQRKRILYSLARIAGAYIESRDLDSETREFFADRLRVLLLAHIDVLFKEDRSLERVLLDSEDRPKAALRAVEVFLFQLACRKHDPKFGSQDAVTSAVSEELGVGESTLQHDCASFRSVIHLWAADLSLERADVPGRWPTSNEPDVLRSFFDKGLTQFRRFLAVAEQIRQVAEDHSLQSPENSWRPPSNLELPVVARIDIPRLSDRQLKALRQEFRPQDLE